MNHMKIHSNYMIRESSRGSDMSPSSPQIIPQKSYHPPYHTSKPISSLKTHIIPYITPHIIPHIIHQNPYHPSKVTSSLKTHITPHIIPHIIPHIVHKNVKFCRKSTVPALLDIQSPVAKLVAQKFIFFCL